MSDLKTVATFANSQEAAVAQMALSEIGIQSFVCDGELVAMDWFYRNAIGYVKLQTADDQAETARAALEAWRDQLKADRLAADATGEENAACLACRRGAAARSVELPGLRLVLCEQTPGAAREKIELDPSPPDGAANDQVNADVDEDAAERAETNATSVRLVIGLIAVGLLALALLRLRDFVQSRF